LDKKMNNDKKNALILLGIALGFIGYSFFLTNKINNAETQISELKSMPHPVEKKVAPPGTKFKMTARRYCEDGNHKRGIHFDGKDQFEYSSPGSDVIRGPFQMDKNLITLNTSKNSQQELVIKSWDNEFNVTDFTLDGKLYSLAVCKSPEQERMEAEKAEQEKLAAEKIEQEKVAAEQERIAAEKARVEQERLAVERVAQEKLAAEKAEQERIAAEKAEQERIAAEKIKAEQEKAKAEQEKLAAEKAKAEQEKLAAEKAKAEKLKAEQEKLAAEKAKANKENDDEEPIAKKEEVKDEAPAPVVTPTEPAKKEDDSSPFLFD
jgi:hypothetical protein